MEKVVQINYLISICFIAYFIISYQYKVLNLRNLERALLTDKGLMLLNIKHLLGILVFGLVFYLIFSDYRYLLNPPEVAGLNIVLLFFLTLIVSAFLSFKSVRKHLVDIKNNSQYSINKAYLYFVIRLVFLLCYEFFFRGVLFFTILEWNGLGTAIIITTVLYMLIHIFDTKEEVFGALPFGIILCLFSYFTNSIWAAFLIHITLSGVYEVSIFNHLTLNSRKS
jgi:membrane protease YdiL (CAAX protease family)